MKKSSLVVAVLFALSSTQLMAGANEELEDELKSKGSRYDGHKSELTVRCVWVPDGSGAGGAFYDGVFLQLGSSGNFKMIEVREISEEDAVACLLAASELPEAKSATE